MFCGECGTKNKESAKFCKDCGAKLSKAKVENKTTTNTNNTNSSSNINMDSIKNFVMKNKMPFIIGGVVILLIILYFILNSLVFGPKKVVLNYAKAQINGDIAKQIEYSSGYGESDFVTKDIVNKKYGNKKVEDEIVKMRVLSDKEVEKLNTGDSKLESTIRKYLDSSQDSSSLYKKYVVEYITKGSTKSDLCIQDTVLPYQLFLRRVLHEQKDSFPDCCHRPARNDVRCVCDDRIRRLCRVLQVPER